MEVAVRKFKLSIVYQNNIEEIIEIQAANTAEAVKKCKEIKEEHDKFISRIESRNIYTNKIIKSCSVCRVYWREELSDCLNDLEKKQD